MTHGAGANATQTLIEGLMMPALADEDGALAELADSGSVTVDGVGLAMSTDSFVVKPLRFPGGSIGVLAVNGTVNDLAMAGAKASGLSRQTSTSIVDVPASPSTRTTPNDVNVNTNTMDAAAITAGRSSGNVLSRNARHGEAPRVAAAASRSGGR